MLSKGTFWEQKKENSYKLENNKWNINRGLEGRVEETSQKVKQKDKEMENKR